MNAPAELCSKSSEGADLAISHQLEDALLGAGGRGSQAFTIDCESNTHPCMHVHAFVDGLSTYPRHMCMYVRIFRYIHEAMHVHMCTYLCSVHTFNFCRSQLWTIYHVIIYHKPLVNLYKKCLREIYICIYIYIHIHKYTGAVELLWPSIR